MNLQDFGYNDRLEKYRKELDHEGFEPGRIIAEHKERYTVFTVHGELEAEITGNMRFSAGSREEFPAVGDWVVLKVYDAGHAIIYRILPRTSVIRRKAAGQSARAQVIAANIDRAFIVQALDLDFNINRLERYLAICHSSRVPPVIVLTKTDLVGETGIREARDRVGSRIKNVPVITLSNWTREGYGALEGMIERGSTCCLLGSSGAGKSTLLNNLCGRAMMKTAPVSTSTGKGKHMTSHRELVVLENGGLMIDNPGLREVGITDEANGLETTFDAVGALAEECRFGNCTHSGEAGCRVAEAVRSGELDKNTYENYLKMQRERVHFESTEAERRKKQKNLGKVIRDYYRMDPKQKNFQDRVSCDRMI